MTAAATSSGLDIGTLVIEGTHLVGGERVPARSGETPGVTNPATRDLLLRVPRGGAADIGAAVRAAESAFPTRRGTSPAVRVDLLARWAALCQEHARQTWNVPSSRV